MLNTDVPISEACKSEWTSMFAEDISRAKEVFQEVIIAIADLKKGQATRSMEILTVKAGGTLNGKIWKEDLSNECSWDELVAHAQDTLLKCHCGSILGE